MHRLDTIHHIVAVGLWRVKTKRFFDAIQECLWRFFVDAHGAIALHVGVAADRTSTCAFLGDAAFDEQQIHDFFDRIHRIFVLCETHRPTSNDLGFVFERRNGFVDLPASKAGLFDQIV